MAAVQIVAVAWWPECEAGKQCHYTRKSQAEMFHDIAYEQVPALKAHAESTADFSELGRDAGAPRVRAEVRAPRAESTKKRPHDPPLRPPSKEPTQVN